MDSQITVFGMHFNTKTFTSDRDANHFIASQNYDYGVIAEVEGVIHCAKIEDEGTDAYCKVA